MGIKKLKEQVAETHNLKLEDVSTSKEIKNWDDISSKERVEAARKIALDGQKTIKKSNELKK